MNSVYRALILCSSLKDAEEFTHHVSSKNYTIMHFVYPPSLSHDKMTPDELLSDCRDLMKEEEYDVIVVTEPGLELVQASLASEFSNLNAASVESVFLCMNRYYSYQHVMYGFTPSYALVELDGYNPKISSSSVATILDNIQADCEVSPVYMTHHNEPLIVQSVKQFNRDVSGFTQVVKMNNESLANVLRDSISFTKYDGALDLTCLFVESRELASTVHLVEGCVVGEEFIPLFIGDLLFWQERPHCLQALSIPSQLEDNNQYQIWATMREIAQRLVSHGFDNQLLRAKVFIGTDGNVKVIEMNSCLDVANIKAYKHAYTNGDILSAALDTGLGRTPHRPKLLPHRHAMRIYVSAFPTESCTAGDVMDFKAAKSEANLHFHVKENSELATDKHYGCLLVTATIMERSFTSCMRKALAITKALLDEKSNSPWLDQDYNDFESCTTESIISTPRFESRPASELSVVLPSIQSSRRSSANTSPEDMAESNPSAKPSVSPEFPRRASSSTLSPIVGVHRRHSSLSPRRLSPILSASHNGNSRNGESKRRRPSNRLSPLATSISRNNLPTDEQDHLSRSPTRIRDLTPVPSMARIRRLSLSSLDSTYNSSDFQLAKTVANHNRRRQSIDFQMNSLERAQHMRRLSDAAAFSTIKLPSLTVDPVFGSQNDLNDNITE